MVGLIDLNFQLGKLTYLCNDLQNAQDYKINGNNCYYKDEF